MKSMRFLKVFSSNKHKKTILGLESGSRGGTWFPKKQNKKSPATVPLKGQ